MSDLESFSFESANQGSTAETFRLFQERMKAAAAQIQAIKAGEQKQKKKEDELAKILSEFIKTHQNDQNFSEFIVHISKLLALNLPAVFILSILLLNFPELQAKTNILMLTMPEAVQASALDAQTLPDLYLQNNQLPPYHKIAIDNWFQTISMTAQDCRTKLLQTALIPAKQFHPAIVEFTAFSLSVYLQTSNYPIEYQFIEKFAQFCLTGILQELQKPTPELNHPNPASI